jgi:hypothetical protein
MTLYLFYELDYYDLCEIIQKSTYEFICTLFKNLSKYAIKGEKGKRCEDTDICRPPLGSLPPANSRARFLVRGCLIWIETNQNVIGYAYGC